MTLTRLLFSNADTFTENAMTDYEVPSERQEFEPTVSDEGSHNSLMDGVQEQGALVLTSEALIEKVISNSIKEGGANEQNSSCQITNEDRQKAQQVFSDAISKNPDLTTASSNDSRPRSPIIDSEVKQILANLMDYDDCKTLKEKDSINATICIDSSNEADPVQAIHNATINVDSEDDIENEMYTKYVNTETKKMPGRETGMVNLLAIDVLPRMTRESVITHTSVESATSLINVSSTYDVNSPEIRAMADGSVHLMGSKNPVLYTCSSPNTDSMLINFSPPSSVNDSLLNCSLLTNATDAMDLISNRVCRTPQRLSGMRRTRSSQTSPDQITTTPGTGTQK